MERQIRFLRDRFFAARPFRDVADLNAQFRRWRDEWAHARPCPGDPSKTVTQALEEERARLLPLPEHPFDCCRVEARSSGKAPYLRFDQNDYSIPPDRVRKPLTLVASHDEIRIFDGSDLVARHPRCYDRRQRIEDPRHIAALVAHKRAARAGKGRDRLCAALAHAEPFFEEIVRRGMPLPSAIQQLLRLLEDYPAEALDAALAEALRRGTPTPASVAHLLEQERRRKHRLPAVPIELPDRPKVRTLRVTPHELETYDALTHSDGDDAD